jgi:SagB-type dehydrogenase family enzyme
VDRIVKGREFMKCSFADRGTDEIADQGRGVPHPPVEKPYDEEAPLIQLPPFESGVIAKADIKRCISDRCSRRKFTGGSLSLAELSFLLWATQGVKEVITMAEDNWQHTARTVPSAGGRHAFETYLAVNRVSDLDTGLYRYLSVEHKLLFLGSVEDLSGKLSAGAFGQSWVGNGAVSFFWSCIPYRSEWRYLDEAHKLMLLDAGHVCQNLYLAAEAISCGCVAIGAYDQGAMDTLIGVDGLDEFVVYLATVGRIEDQAG